MRIRMICLVLCFCAMALKAQSGNVKLEAELGQTGSTFSNRPNDSNVEGDFVFPPEDFTEQLFDEIFKKLPMSAPRLRVFANKLSPVDARFISEQEKCNIALLVTASITQAYELTELSWQPYEKGTPERLEIGIVLPVREISQSFESKVSLDRVVKDVVLMIRKKFP